MQISQEIYLDHSATTPLDPEVWQVMQNAAIEFGNPASIHKTGQRAKKILNLSRRRIAQLCSCQPQEIIFTPSATISNNLILQGLIFQEKNIPPHFITTSLEHPSIFETLLHLEKQGKITLSFLPTNKSGIICIDDLEKLLQENTKLVSITSASSEIGTLQPIAEVAELTQQKKIILHTDATQLIGIGALPNKNVDAFTLSSHKIYGPKGAGLLFLRAGLNLQPLFYGGGQEQGLSVGTENLLAIVGLTKALELALEKKDAYNKKMQKLGGLLDKLIATEIPEAIFVGDRKKRLYFHRNYLFPHCLAEEILMHMDLQGICLSSRSACSSGSGIASPILIAMGYSKTESLCSIRVSLGAGNDESQITRFVKILKLVLDKIRKK